MKSMLRESMAAAVLVALTAARSVCAQGAGSAEAEELFQQGRAALESRDYSLACAKFGASLQLEPAVGTLMSLAECEEAQGELAGARQHWQEAADLADAKNDSLRRGAYCRQKLAAVDVRVPRLRVYLATGAPNDTTLLRDKVSLGTAGFDVELPVDPGAHVLAVSARGHETNRYSVELGEGEHKAIEVEPGKEVALSPPAATSASSSPVPAPAGAMAPSSARPVPSGMTTRRAIAYVVGGVGVAGIGIGAYFGIRTFAEAKAATDLCPCDGAVRETAVQHQNTARTDGAISTVAFAVGGAAAAAGILLWLTAPSARAAEHASRVTFAPAADPRGVALLVKGRW
jgi:hypothetical protein